MKCNECDGEGGYWTWDQYAREWEFSVCEVCNGKGEVIAVHTQVAE